MGMNRKYLLAAALAIWAAPPLHAQTVKSGIEAWQRADYSGAVAVWRPLAETGDADAQFNLGQAYRLGRGVPTNLAAAKTWFERAANQGHIDAETTLGLLLFQNNDQAEGLKWLKKASDKGEARAMLVYGTALVNGDSVTQDPVLGYAYVSRSAAQGLEPARQTLAQLDELLPAAERKRGVELARQLAGNAPPPAKSASTVSAKPKPAPKAPARTAAAAAAPAKPSPAPAAARSASGNWRIQLGAFSKRGSAEALYKTLSSKAALAGRSPFYIAAGPITRLQVGPFESKSAAQAACSALAVACFPVAAK
jgi:cell division septation protein DedD